MSLQGTISNEKDDSKDLAEDEKENWLPPLIILNPRKKIGPQELPVTSIMMKTKQQQDRRPAALMWLSYQKPIIPVPRRPISITWWPEVLHFELHKKTVHHGLNIQNRSTHTLEMHCCGLWGEDGRLGAKWRCFPRTIFALAPGLSHVIHIKATPREESPVKNACIKLQLATTYPRDHVVGFFGIPIKAEFLNFKAPSTEEDGTVTTKSYPADMTVQDV